MDAALFTKMLSDKNVLDLRGLGYQFPQADIKEFTELLKNGFYHSLPLKDFSGQNIVYLSSIAQVRLSAAKVLFDAAEQHPALRGQGDGGGDCFHLHH